MHRGYIALEVNVSQIAKHRVHKWIMIKDSTHEHKNTCSLIKYIMFNVLTCLANIEPPPTQIQGKFQCLSPGSVDNTPTILQCLLCHSIQMFDLCSLLSDWTGTITFHSIWFDKTGSPWLITEIIQNRNVMNGYVGKMILFKLNIPSWLFKSVYCLLALKSFFYENCCSHI